MTDDRLSGSAKNIGGQVEEGFGRLTGDERMQLEGRARQAEGALQDVYGQAKDTAVDAAGAPSIRRGGTAADDNLVPLGTAAHWLAGRQNETYAIRRVGACRPVYQRQRARRSATGKFPRRLVLRRAYCRPFGILSSRSLRQSRQR